MIRIIATGLLLATLLPGPPVSAEGQRDVFRGKLFPPNVILEHQDRLGLSKDQFKAIKAAVVEVQSNVAEHEWDMREAYMAIKSELDKSPIDERSILALVDKALLAENEIKKEQMTMLIRLRNLLTAEQVAWLEAQQAEAR